MEKKTYIIDFTNIEYCSEVHSVIKSSLDFPDYYGCNWDAFWDCLSEMYGEPVHIEIIGIDVLESKFEGVADKMIKILKRYKHFNNDFFSDNIKIDIVREDGVITLE